MNKFHDFTEDAHVRLEQRRGGGEDAFIVLLPCCILHPCCSNVNEFMGLPMMEHKGREIRKFMVDFICYLIKF